MPLTALYQSAVKLLEPLTDEETYKIVIEEAKKLSGCTGGSLFLADSKKRLIRIYSNISAERQIAPRKNGFAYEAYRKRKIVIITPRMMKQIHPEVKKKPSTYVVMIPISFAKESMGVIILQSNKKVTLSKRRMQILQLFGSMVTLKLRNNIYLHESQAALETRDLFISMASHELKTPLTTISAYSQLIEKKLLNGAEINMKWLDVLHGATARMSRLINELLHVNQIRTGKLKYYFQSTHLLQIAHQAKMDLHSFAPEYEVKIHDHIKHKDDDVVSGDPDKLVQVGNNLLNNAAKFSPPEKPIVITIAKEKNKVTFSVTNYGPTIDAKDLPYLFNEFYKVGNHTKEGLGLGLFISKKIVEAHRGKISVSSTERDGTTFKVSIPALQK
jgi:signal transduction histidine kinase